MSLTTESNRRKRFRVAVRRFGAFEQAIATQWTAFDADHKTGLELDLVSLDLQPLEHALFASGGMANGDWDVAFVATDWVSAMNQLHCAVDLAPLIAADPPQDWPHGWTDSLLRLQTLGPQVLGVPYHDGPECLIFRRDLFEDPTHRERFFAEFGRELGPPRTWTEFHETARFFNDPKSNLHGTAFAAFPDGHNSVYDFLLQLWTRGGELLTPDGALRFDTPEAEAALTFYRCILSDSQASLPECLQLDSVSLGERFANGQIAMMINWFGFAAMAHTSSDSAVRGCVQIAPIPFEAPGSSVSLNVYWLLSIASGGPHIPVAWNFLRHVLTREMDRITTLSGAIGCRRTTWSDPEINKLIPFYCGVEKLHRSAREIPPRSNWPLIAGRIDKLITRTITTDISICELLREAQLGSSAY